MYTLERAARIMGVTRVTVINWMKKCGIKGRVITTDRKRVHLSRNDMVTLVGEFERKMTKRDKGGRKRMNEDLGMTGGDKHAQEKMEEDFYSLANAASFLGVSESSVNKWIKKHNIEKKIIITDKKRLYISRANLLMLADLYGRKAAKRVPADITIKREDGDFQEEAEKRLYSVAEVALFLNASEASVKRWIRVHNIEKKVTSANRRRVHISYKDMLMLADVQQRNVTPNILPINVVEELKELRSKLKDLASDIEDIKHDFRVYVERSIYIG